MARMRGQMVRYWRRQWALIQWAADHEDVSASQFVRDTSYGASVWLLASEAEQAGVPQLAERLRELDDTIAQTLEAITGASLPEDDEDDDGNEHGRAGALDGAGRHA